MGRNTVMLLAAVGLATATLGATPAAARIARVPGDIRCTISNASMTFVPGLRYRQHIEGVQSGRGNSFVNLTADLSGCTAANGGAAPADIDHGTLNGLGKVSGSYCEKLQRVRVSTTAVWYQATQEIAVGTTNAKLKIDVAMPSFNDPWTLSFAGRAKAGSTVFPHDPVSFSLVTTSPNWAISGACFKLSLDSLAFGNGTYAADVPG